MKYLNFKKWMIIFLTLALFFTMPTYGFAGEPTGQETNKMGASTGVNLKDPFRVVGYYSGDLFNEPVDLLQMDKLTHIMYAFLIPTGEGTCLPLEKPEQLRELVKKGHAQGTEIFIAVGGWSYQGNTLVSEFETLAANKETRSKFVNSVLAVVKEYQLDGVELDWEHPNKKTIGNYERLVIELGDALKKEGKQLTAALNGAWSTTAGPEVSQLMTDGVLNTFSFINVMAYDMNNEDHSPLWFANTSIEYWAKRGVPSEKIVIGIPLYSRPSWKQYRHLVAEDPQNAYKDFVSGTPASYYNGLNTIREKTKIALKKAGGVMLFDVNEDAQGDLSALSAIHETVNLAKGMTKENWKKYITVILDNQVVNFQEEADMGNPFVDENNRTLVPMRKIFETVGAKVRYDQETKVITVEKGEVRVQVTAGSNLLYVNGEAVPMDTKAIIKNDRTYIPLRATFEPFGYAVKWSQASGTVYINKK
ncbi:MAG: glycosyl hydrolase family 18 protein [Anaerovorax sp.]